MRCADIQDRIIEGRLEAGDREHLAACAECAAMARDAETLAAGLHLLAQEAAPEPSWGFSERVLRRLGEAPARFFEPLEVIGRRAVFAAGLLAATVLMVVTLSNPTSLRERLDASFSNSTESSEVLLAGGVDESEDLSVFPDGSMGGDSR
jgi:hypothetical protein